MHGQELRYRGFSGVHMMFHISSPTRAGSVFVNSHIVTLCWKIIQQVYESGG
jgi:hypothetical protein